MCGNVKFVEPDRSDADLLSKSNLAKEWSLVSWFQLRAVTMSLIAFAIDDITPMNIPLSYILLLLLYY